MLAGGGLLKARWRAAIRSLMMLGGVGGSLLGGVAGASRLFGKANYQRSARSLLKSIWPSLGGAMVGGALLSFSSLRIIGINRSSRKEVQRNINSMWTINRAGAKFIPNC